MILRKEIEQVAEQKGVARDTIDKDWVLGHFLAGIYAEPTLREVLIFKGGTCLKKCWFPDYRFSEDLDFTSRKHNFELTKRHVDVICDHVNKHASILTHVASLIPLKFENKIAGYEIVIKFWGANHAKNDVPPSPERWHSKIKIEVILYEILLFAQVNRKIIHDYSDQLALEPNLIPCYQIEEMLAEKLRALIQRSYTAPRDYYDIWYLSKSVEGLNWNNIVKGFHEKMKFKNLEFTGIEQFINEDNDKRLKGAWKNSLAHQIPGDSLPGYDTVKVELADLFKKEFDKAK
jgi:predicted nucleotidyltransferase component of viral defense system